MRLLLGEFVSLVGVGRVGGEVYDIVLEVDGAVVELYLAEFLVIGIFLVKLEHKLDPSGIDMTEVLHVFRLATLCPLEVDKDSLLPLKTLRWNDLVGRLGLSIRVGYLRSTFHGEYF